MWSDESLQGLASRLVGASYVAQGSEAIRRRRKLVRVLLEHRRLPAEGWDAATLEWFVAETALLDSNNFVGNVGAGEREARVACDAVRRRHFGLAHGIGRSGDVAAVQPKAAGSSLINKLAVELVRDLVRNVLGMRLLKGVLLLPMATGMALTLVLQCLRHSELARRGVRPRYVLWPRIDQATCLKCVRSAGFEVVVVENRLDGDAVRTDLDALAAALARVGADDVLCVLSTTSCFAPRVPDDVAGIARLCAAAGVAHVVNNAYGLQCSKCCHVVNEACRVGRVDAVVQSTDKNLLVPVGGSIVTGPDRRWVETELSQSYPGRASMSPVLDVFLTLMSLGAGGYKRLRAERQAMAADGGAFRTAVAAVAAKFGERVLQTQKAGNTISFAVTLESLRRRPRAPTVAPTVGSTAEDESQQVEQVGQETVTTTPNKVTTPKEVTTPNEVAKSNNVAPVAGAALAEDNGAQAAAGAQEGDVASPSEVTRFGSMLFTRGVSGARVVSPGMAKTVSGIAFANYGASHGAYPHAYVTLACAIGLQPSDIPVLVKRLEQCFADVAKQQAKDASYATPQPPPPPPPSQQ